MSTETKEKKPRAKRRNYERELANLKSYLEIKVDVLKSIDTGADPNNWKQSIDAYADILRRVG